MDYCHIEFEPKDEPSLRRMSALFGMIKAAKESGETGDDSPFVAYLTEAERAYFWNPTPEEQAQWNEEWFSTPLPKRHSPEMVLPQWHLESMLDAFWNGDYDFVAIVEESGRHYLAFNPNGYPYGGTGSMVAFVECFGHRVVGIEDGTGYARYVARTKFWKPRTEL
jgi:hypothetical protein